MASWLMYAAVPDRREARGDGSTMGESGRCEGLAGSVASGGRAEPASNQASALDATGNPGWGQVLVTTVRLWLSRRMPRVSIEWQHRDWPGASQAPRPARALGRPADRGVRRSAGAAVPRGSAGAAVPRGSYRRVLAASMLGLGLLA